MAKVPVVTINTDYVARFLAQNKISGADFGRRMGYSDHWWASVQKKKHVKPNVAYLMCNMFQLEYDKLVVKESEPAPKTETLVIDAEVAEALAASLNRIETKLDKLLSIWG